MSSKNAVLVSGTESACCFCKKKINDDVKLGEMFKLRDLYIHYYCVLLSYGVAQNGLDEEGVYGFLYEDIKSGLRRFQNILCYYCRKAGASMQCCIKKCNVKFHLPCGLDKGCMSRFSNEFPSFCANHRPKQQVSREALLAASQTAPVCPICLCDVNYRNRADSLWAPCCEKSWYHRMCLEKLALSAASLLKCAACSNVDTFRNAMIHYGIYVPERDAAWELEPNAFQDLNFRYQHCDADNCKCPQGRKSSVDGSRWEIIVCQTCGSQGTHVVCGKVKFHKTDWECADCSTLTKKPSIGETSSSLNDESRENESSETGKKRKGKKRKSMWQKGEETRRKKRKTSPPKNLLNSLSTPRSCSVPLRDIQASDSGSSSQRSYNLRSSSPVTATSSLPSSASQSPTPEENDRKEETAEKVDVVDICDSDSDEVVKIEVVRRPLCGTKQTKDLEPFSDDTITYSEHPEVEKVDKATSTIPEKKVGRTVVPLATADQKNEFILVHGKIYSCVECKEGYLLLEPATADAEAPQNVVKSKILRELNDEDKPIPPRPKKSPTTLIPQTQERFEDFSKAPSPAQPQTPVALNLPLENKGLDINGTNYEVIASHLPQNVTWVLPEIEGSSASSSAFASISDSQTPKAPITLTDLLRSSTCPSPARFVLSSQSGSPLNVTNNVPLKNTSTLTSFSRVVQQEQPTTFQSHLQATETPHQYTTLKKILVGSSVSSSVSFTALPMTGLEVDPLEIPYNDEQQQPAPFTISSVYSTLPKLRKLAPSSLPDNSVPFSATNSDSNDQKELEKRATKPTSTVSPMVQITTITLTSDEEGGATKTVTKKKKKKKKKKLADSSDTDGNLPNLQNPHISSEAAVETTVAKDPSASETEEVFIVE